MARITVEDCLGKIGDDNRFSLVHLAVERVKQRRQGSALLIPTKKNKEVVMALREVPPAQLHLIISLICPSVELKMQRLMRQKMMMQPSKKPRRPLDLHHGA